MCGAAVEAGAAGPDAVRGAIVASRRLDLVRAAGDETTGGSGVAVEGAAGAAAGS